MTARWTTLTALVVVAALGVDLFAGPQGPVGYEEGLNARAGLLVACGHADALLDLQYRPFCGGCSVDAVLAAPLFTLLGTATWVWRLVPALLALLGLAAGAVLLRQGAAEPDAAARATLAWLLLELGAPGWIRAQGLTGWGNHAEGAALALVALALAGASRGRGVPLCLAGGLASFATWAAPGTAWVLPTVGVLALQHRARGVAALLAGAPLGWAALAVQVRARPDHGRALAELWQTAELAPPAALRRWLWDDFVRGGLWPRPAWTEPDAVAVVWCLTLLGVAGFGLLQGARRRPRSPAALAGAVGILALILSHAVRHDLWDDNPAVVGFDWFNLRYRYALWPLLALGAGVAAGRDRRALAGVALLSAVGFAHRVDAWRSPALHGADTPAAAVDLAADPTVPSGLPRQRLARSLSRPQDLDAARDFLDSHADPLPWCRAHHAHELGRRSGLADRPPPRLDGLDPALQQAVEAGRHAGARERQRRGGGAPRDGSGRPQ